MDLCPSDSKYWLLSHIIITYSPDIHVCQMDMNPVGLRPTRNGLLAESHIVRSCLH